MAKSKMGRPSMVIDHEKLKGLMNRNPTLEDTSVIMNLSIRQLTRVIRKHYDMTFVQFRELYMAPIRLKLVDSILQSAFKGNIQAQIFCLKNLCGWTEKKEVDFSSKQGIEIKIDQDDSKL